MDVPEDIRATAKELARRITAPTVIEKLGELLSVEERIAIALRDERERCAQIAESVPLNPRHDGAVIDIAKAIRA